MCIPAAEPHPAFSPSNFKRLWIPSSTQQETSPFSLPARRVQKARRREILEKNTLFYAACKLPYRERHACTRSTQSTSDRVGVPGCREGAGGHAATTALARVFRALCPTCTASKRWLPQQAYPWGRILISTLPPLQSAQEGDAMLRTCRAGVYTAPTGTPARRGWWPARRHNAGGDTLPNCMFIGERWAENRTLCSSTRPAVFT